ncbi:hypothetical protein JA1_001379 [Spathaspora sp. JA1]|nr:hypothetical protein JA1_001379 [Spathaspora sp. JA1]
MKLSTILFLFTYVGAIDLPLFNVKKSGKFQARDACSESCVDVGKVQIDKCKLGQTPNPSREELFRQTNCVCKLPDSFYEDLSDCYKNCASHFDTSGVGNGDLSPSSLRSAMCRAAAAVSSLVEGQGGFATEDVGAAETNTGDGGNGANTGTRTGTTKTNGNGSATTSSNGTKTSTGKTSGNGTTKTDKTSSETSSKETSANAGSSRDSYSIIYLMIMALI